MKEGNTFSMGVFFCGAGSLFWLGRGGMGGVFFFYRSCFLATYSVFILFLCIIYYGLLFSLCLF